MSVAAESIEQLDSVIREAVRDGIKERLRRDYNNPLDALITAAIATQKESLKAMLEEAIATFAKDQAFRDEISSSVRSVMAKTLVQRFGGEMEKQVNALKSDPTTRARITLAIEEIVKQKTAS